MKILSILYFIILVAILIICILLLVRKKQKDTYLDRNEISIQYMIVAPDFVLGLNNPQTNRDASYFNPNVWCKNNFDKMGKGDIAIFGGDYFMPAKFQPSMVAAIDRGALVLVLDDLYFQSKPGINLVPTKYQNAILNSVSTEITNKAGFKVIRIPVLPGITHVHSKINSFYFASQNYASVFYGSWNCNPGLLLDSGIAITGNFNNKLIQASMFRDYITIQSVLNELKNIAKKPSSVSNPLEQFASLWKNQNFVDAIIVDKVHFCGPNYCNRNQQNNVNFTEYNVPFKVGIDPQDKWTDSSTQFNKLNFGWNLVLELLNEAQAYTKLILLEDYLTATGWAGVSLLEKPAEKSISRGIKWYDIKGASKDNNTSWWNFISKYPNQFGSKYYAANLETSTPAAPQNFATHLKDYFTDNGVVISTQHPGYYFYMGKLLYGYEILIKNKRIAAYFDDFFNWLWTYRSLPSPSFAKKTLPPLVCAENKCCDHDFTITGSCGLSYNILTPPVTSTIKFVYSNPFDSWNKLLQDPFGFYSVIVSLIYNAQKYLYICNLYQTMGIQKPKVTYSDYIPNIVYEALLSTIKRGVQVTFVYMKAEEQQKTEAFFKQFTGYSNVSTYLFTKGFMHNKVYLSENAAYIGGQNWSLPGSLDAGIYLEGSVLLQNIKSYVLDILIGGNIGLPQFYTLKNPLTETFIAQTKTNGIELGIADMCLASSPQGNLLLQDNGVQNDLDAMTEIISKAQEFVWLVNYEFNYDDVMLGAKPNPIFTKFIKLIGSKANAGLDVQVFTTNDRGPMAVPALVNQTLKLLGDKVKVHYWGAHCKHKDSFFCKILHAKIIITDAGFCLSSANMTPLYYFGTTFNTSLVMRYHPGQPKLLEKDIRNFINTLSQLKVSKSCFGTKYIPPSTWKPCPKT